SVKRKKMEEALKLTKGANKKMNNTQGNFFPSSNKSTLSGKDNTSKTVNKTNKSHKDGASIRGLRSNATRPQSVFARRGDDDIFYLDKGFSDYFTQEESEFASKFPLLHPKVRCNSKSLKKTLRVVKKSNIQCEQLNTLKKTK